MCLINYDFDSWTHALTRAKFAAKFINFRRFCSFTFVTTEITVVRISFSLSNFRIRQTDFGETD